MANEIILKTSGVQGSAPDIGDLSLGELAWNYYDGKLYGKTYDGETYAIVDLTSVTVSDMVLSGIGIIGKNTAGQGAALELTATQARALLNVSDNADATGFLGIKTAAQVDALTGMSAGQWVVVSDEYYRRRWYTGSEWLPGNKKLFMNSEITSFTGDFPTSIGCTLSNGVSDKVNFRGYIHDLGIIKGMKLVLSPDADVAAGDAQIDLIFQCGSIGEHYSIISNSHLDQAYSFTANAQYDLFGFDLPLSLMANVDYNDIIGVYINRDGSAGADTLGCGIVVSGIMFEYIPRPE